MRAIWETYAGWFHHRSTTELYDVPPSVIATDVVALAGADALASAARDRLAADEPVAALHLTDLVLSADPTTPLHARSLRRRIRALLVESEQLLGAGLADRSTRTDWRFNDQHGSRSTITVPAVFVTGGTSGIGHALATAFAGAGASVTVTGTKAGPGDYETELGQFDYRRCEMTDPSTIDESSMRWTALTSS